MEPHISDSKPWYKQLWPWLIISLPASAVIAGLSTLYIAIENQDALVKDNWYKDGKAINQRYEQDRLATSLGLRAEIRVDQIAGDLNLSLSGRSDFQPPEKLFLELFHPTLAPNDQKIILRRIKDFSYHGNLQQTLRGKRHVSITNSLAGQNSESSTLSGHVWRLRGTAFFPLDSPFILGE